MPLCDWHSTMLVCSSPVFYAHSIFTLHEGTFSGALKAQGLPNGAADGLMIWDPTEILRTENNGLQNIVSILSPLPAQFGVSPGDLLHVSKFIYILIET